MDLILDSSWPFTPHIGSAFLVMGVPQMVQGYQELPYREGIREKALYQNAAKPLGLPA